MKEVLAKTILFAFVVLVVLGLVCMYIILSVDTRENIDPITPAKKSFDMELRDPNHVPHTVHVSQPARENPQATAGTHYHQQGITRIETHNPQEGINAKQLQGGI